MYDDARVDPRATNPDGRSLRWAKHNEQRRAAIIQAAIDVLESSEPGEQVHVQQIAEKAGLGRAALYRHFADRDDLDRAVQERLLEMVIAEVMAPGIVDGGVHDVIGRAVQRYVHWAHQHRSLHRFAAREVPDKRLSPLRTVMGAISEVTLPLLRAGAEVVGAELDSDDEATIDLAVFGVVTEVVSAVRLWLARGEERTPSPEALAERLTELVWWQLEGLARARGAVLDPDLPFKEVLRALPRRETRITG